MKFSASITTILMLTVTSMTSMSSSSGVVSAQKDNIYKIFNGNNGNNGSGNGNGNSGNGNGNNGSGNGGGNRPIKDPEEDVALLIKYKDHNGKNVIKQNSNNGKIDRDITEYKIASIKSKRKNIRALNNNPHIEYVGFDAIHTKLGYPDDIRGVSDSDVENISSSSGGTVSKNNLRRKMVEDTSLYGLTQVQATQLSQGSTVMKVCVIDTGYAMGHEDLPTSSTTSGFNPYNDGSKWDVDKDGHGTHCAGTIGAIGNNNKGVTSVNPDPTKFNFLIGKGLADNGYGSTSAIIEATTWCKNQGANIVSMSLGCSDESTCNDASENQALTSMYENDNILIVAAAGNDGNSAKSWPASYSSVMSVGATTSSETRWSDSQYNNQVEISAPGSNIKSTATANNGENFVYRTWSGTSMATPHVAGVAALVWSHFPQCTNKQIRNVLLASAKDKGANGCDEEFGYGIVQAKAAYDLLQANGCNAYTSTNDSGGCSQAWSGPPSGPTPTPPTGPTPTPPTAPTPSPPTGPAPTLPPTNNGGCASGEAFVKVTLTTDDYGKETDWRIKDANGVIHADLGRSTELENNKQYVTEVCVPSNACRFIIKDDYGDGICCEYGSGSYKVERNGVIVKDNGGNFGAREEINMCQ